MYRVEWHPCLLEEPSVQLDYTVAINLWAPIRVVWRQDAIRRPRQRSFDCNSLVLLFCMERMVVNQLLFQARLCF